MADKRPLVASESRPQTATSFKDNAITLLIWLRRLIVDDIPIDGSDDRKRRRIGMLSLFILIGVPTTFFVDILCSLCGISFFDYWAQIKLEPLPDQAIGPAAASIATTIGGAVGLWTFFYASREKQDSLSRQLRKDREIARQDHERELAHESLRHDSALKARWEATLESNFASTVERLHSPQESQVLSAIQTLVELGAYSFSASTEAHHFAEEFPFFERCINRLIDAQTFLPSKSLSHQCSRGILRLLDFAYESEAPTQTWQRLFERTLNINIDTKSLLDDFIACFSTSAPMVQPEEAGANVSSGDSKYEQFCAELQPYIEQRTPRISAEQLPFAFGVMDVNGRLSRGAYSSYNSNETWRVIGILAQTSLHLHKIVAILEKCEDSFDDISKSSRESCLIITKSPISVSSISPFVREVVIFGCTFKRHNSWISQPERTRFVQCTLLFQSISYEVLSEQTFSYCLFEDVIVNHNDFRLITFIGCEFVTVDIVRNRFELCVFYECTLSTFAIWVSKFDYSFFHNCVADSQIVVTRSYFHSCNLSSMGADTFRWLEVEPIVQSAFDQFTYRQLEKLQEMDSYDYGYFAFGNDSDFDCRDAFKHFLDSGT
jgi:hypothetical protein